MQEKSPILNRPLRVMHIISGDLWAGAEAQAFTLLKHLHQSTSLAVVLMNEGELSRRLQDLQIPITIIPESHFNSLQILQRLIKVIHAFKPDVLHTHRQKENILGNIANQLSAVPLKKRAYSVRTSHGSPEFKPMGKQKIQMWLDTWIGKHLQQAVIAVSADLAERLKAIFPAQKIHVVRNGVDSEALRAEASITDFRLQAPQHIHIGIIGRLEPVKRIDIFIDMAILLLGDKALPKSFMFHIIGDGSLRRAMEKKVNELQYHKQIVFHGHRNDIASCIYSLDAILMCSDHEGTPMVALEALALGKPLIAHNVGGLREVLEDIPSLLVSPNTPSEYARKILHLFTNGPINVNLNGKFTAAKNAELTASIYKSASQSSL